MTAEPTSVAAKIVARVKSIILHPKQEWPRIAAEDTTTGDVFLYYVLPLALIGPVAGLIGGEIFGYSFFGWPQHISTLGAVVGAAATLAISLMCFVIMASIAESLTTRYGGEPSVTRGFKLVAYAATPAWLVGIFALVPAATYLGVLALYSVYLIYTGVGPMLGVQRPRAYTFALILCGVVLDLAVAAASLLNMRLLAGMGLMG